MVLDLGGTELGERGAVVTVNEVKRWEQEHGTIPGGSLLILRTGWSQFVSQPDSFFGIFSDESAGDTVMPGKTPPRIFFAMIPIVLLVQASLRLLHPGWQVREAWPAWLQNVRP